MLLFQLKKDTSSSAHYSALATLSPYYFEPVIRSKAEAGRNVDNKLYAEAANVPCPPCSTGLKSLEMGTGILLALVGKTEKAPLPSRSGNRVFESFTENSSSTEWTLNKPHIS